MPTAGGMGAPSDCIGVAMRLWCRPGMRWLLWSLVWGLAAFGPQLAKAESLRCEGGSVAEGDTRLSVAYKCGQPLLKDSSCAPLYVREQPLWQPVPEAWASRTVPCQVVEDWLYERGPGNLMATVRLRDGVVLSIRYGRTPG